MSRFTVLRVEVDSDIVERALRVTPGVEVVEGFDSPAEERPPTADEREPAEDDAGLLERATPDDDLLEAGSPLREYGLLGLGASFVMLGIATVGIWWYRRRKGGPETPEPNEFEPRTDFGSTGVETATTEVGPAGAPSTDTDETASQTDDSESLSIVTPEESEDDEERAAETDDDAGRADDREDVEWEPKWDTEPKATAGESEDAADESDDTADERASDSVDVAPLLGVAFLAVTGAVVRWVTGDEQ